MVLRDARPDGSLKMISARTRTGRISNRSSSLQRCNTTLSRAVGFVIVIVLAWLALLASLTVSQVRLKVATTCIPPFCSTSVMLEGTEGDGKIIGKPRVADSFGTRRERLIEASEAARRYNQTRIGPTHTDPDLPNSKDKDNQEGDDDDELSDDADDDSGDDNNDFIAIPKDIPNTQVKHVPDMVTPKERRTRKKAHRPPLKPIWDEELVEYYKTSEMTMMNRLRAQYPDDDEAILRIRADFGSMAICNQHNVWYSCLDNPSCIELDKCSHRLPDDVHFKTAFELGLRFHRQRGSRRIALHKILERMRVKFNRAKEDKTVFLMSLNSGFSFLFGNWLCSLRAHGLDENAIKARTIVFARDPDAQKYVDSLGWFSPTIDEINELAQWTQTHPVSKRAAPIFGQGDHNVINLFLKFGIPLDLVSMGYTFISQDVDFVWLKDPVPEMIQRCNEVSCDGIFISEGRVFVNTSPDIGMWRPSPRPLMEFNTGLYMMRPSAPVKYAMQILMQGVFLQQWRRRDQLYYNTILWHERFSNLKLVLLPDSSFIPGKRLHNKELETRPLDSPEKLTVIHVSDTGNFEIKIKRLKSIGHWYFKENTCPEPVTLCRSIGSCWASLATCVDC